ncbi:MAG: FAD-dependent oxidoreductase, partial [Advenella sp.]
MAYKKYRNVDVVVVGAGLAGHCAAIEAAASGATVLILERESQVGGSSILSGGSFAFAGTSAQQQANIEDSAQRLTNDFLTVGGNRNDPSLVAVYAHNQLDAYHWLVMRGVEFGPIIAGAGQSVPRLHPANPREVVRLLSEEISSNPNIELLTSARVKRLRRDKLDGHVASVLLEHDDETVEVCVNAGVILSTGGFSRNEAMLAEFAPGQATAKRVGGAGSQGEGLLMAWHLGAGLRDMGYIKGTFGNHPDAHPTQHTAMLGIYKGAIAVNKLGKRFADESISYKLLGDACLQQPDSIGFQILDQSIMDQAVPQAPMFDFVQRLNEGRLLKAATIAELAELIGIDPLALEQTVNEYNADISNGVDHQFGRIGIVQGFGKLTQIKTAPFYAYPSTSAIIATYCGLTVNDHMQVLDVFGSP